MEAENLDYFVDRETGIVYIYENVTGMILNTHEGSQEIEDYDEFISRRNAGIITKIASLHRNSTNDLFDVTLCVYEG